MFDVKMNKKIYIFFSIFSENNILFSNEKKETSAKYNIITINIISLLDNGIISLIYTVKKYKKFLNN
jgi:hypothetical protein